MNPLQWLWSEGDALNIGVAVVLLVMSVTTWVLIFWKAWLLRRVGQDMGLSLAALWQAPTLAEARQALLSVDREQVVLPLLMAAEQAMAPTAASVRPLSTQGDGSQRLTRHLRQALHGVLSHLQAGQVVLASVGATAPFVGLLGTVWGIYNALVGMASEGQVTVERISGPVGEALIMTAAGLVVAIPAVLAYNVFGRTTARVEAELEGLAHDLRELLVQQSAEGSVADASVDTPAPSQH